MKMSEWNHDSELIKKIIAKYQESTIKKRWWACLLIVIFFACLLHVNSIYAENILNARQYYLNGDFKKSVKAYEILRQQQPENLDILIGLYAGYQKTQSFNSKIIKEKIEVMDELKGNIAIYQLTELELMELIRQQPERDILYHQLALKKSTKGEWHDVLELYKKASHLKPMNLTYKFNLAVAQDKNGNKKSALTLYQKIMGENISSISRYEVEARIKELISEKNISN